MDLTFKTPVLWYPGQSEVDFQEELGLMLERSFLTEAFLQGELDPESFLDYLDEQGFNVFELAAVWGLEGWELNLT